MKSVPVPTDFPLISNSVAVEFLTFSSEFDSFHVLIEEREKCLASF